MNSPTSDSTGQTPWRTAGIWPMLVLALTFGVIYHYPIVESDLFWQIRAGEEILRTHQVQTFDTWSSTAQGSAWYNFQWLSCLIEYWVSQIGPPGSYLYLPSLRAFLVFALTLFLGVSFQRSILSEEGATGFSTSQHRIVLWIGVALFQFLILPRLLMRPEMLIFWLDVCLLDLWFFKVAWKWRALGALGILIFWSNLHAGLAPLGIFQALALVWADLCQTNANTKIKSRVLLSASILFTPLLSPIGYHGLLAPWMVMTSYPSEILRNPDQASFSWGMDGSPSSISSHLFLFVALLGIVTLIRSAIRLTRIQQKPFQKICAWIRPALGVLLVGATLSKARILPFAAIYMIYPFSELLCVLVKKSAAQLKPRILEGLAISGVLMSISSQVSAEYFMGLTPGFGILEGKYPEQSARFIRENQLPHELFNDFDFGGYLVGRLRQYRVSMDGRELPFIPLLTELRTVSEKGSPAEFDSFLKQHSFQTLLLEPRPYLPGFQDPLLALAPPERWALVFFDDASLVYVRRTPEWEPFIEAHELKLLQHGRPPELIASGILKNPEVKSSLEKELARCLLWKPTPRYCQKVLELKTGSGGGGP